MKVRARSFHVPHSCATRMAANDPCSADRRFLFLQHRRHRTVLPTAPGSSLRCLPLRLVRHVVGISSTGMVRVDAGRHIAGMANACERTACDAILSRPPIQNIPYPIFRRCRPKSSTFGAHAMKRSRCSRWHLDPLAVTEFGAFRSKQSAFSASTVGNRHPAPTADGWFLPSRFRQRRLATGPRSATWSGAGCTARRPSPIAPTWPCTAMAASIAASIASSGFRFPHHRLAASFLTFFGYADQNRSNRNSTPEGGFGVVSFIFIFIFIFICSDFA